MVKKSTPPTTIPGGALNGTPEAVNPATVKKIATTAAPASSTPVGEFNPATATAPTSSSSLFGVSQADAGQPLVGDNSDLLGTAGKAGTTIADAVSSVAKMTPAEIDTLQTALRSAGVLAGKYHSGQADVATTDALRSAVVDATRNNKTVSSYLSDLSTSSLVAAATTAAAAKPPLQTDPQSIAVSLQNAYTQYGLGQVPASAMNEFAAQIQSKEASKNATRVSVDPVAEATVYAAAVAAKTPGAATHAQTATNADITKSAAAMGVVLTPAAMKNIAAKVDANTKATGSPDVNLLNQLVAQQFTMPKDPSHLSGDAATVYNNLQKLAGQYLLPSAATPTALSSWITKAIRNQSYAGSVTGDTEAEYEQYLRQQASIQMPWLAQASGGFDTVTPWAATASYRQKISDVLGLGNADAVDLTSAQYSPLLKTNANGQPPTLSEMEQTIMSDPKYGYDQSPNGIARGYTMGLALSKSLGINLAGV